MRDLLKAAASSSRRKKRTMITFFATTKSCDREEEPQQQKKMPRLRLDELQMSPRHFDTMEYWYTKGRLVESPLLE
uniref:Uncharacterized protein n=1 Tax=Peronospora matthiolae TaxID=2874970 RepID=A0AAV1UV24_9STRA